MKEERKKLNQFCKQNQSLFIVPLKVTVKICSTDKDLQVGT